MALAAFLAAIQLSGPAKQSANPSLAGYLSVAIFAAVVGLVVLVIIRSSGRGVPKS